MNNRIHPPLYGLVLVGGKSIRMEKDKSLLIYYSKIQAETCYELLKLFCQKVFISNRKDQSELFGQRGLPQIHDKKEYANTGPLAGILSAMDTCKNVAWLVVACDLPYMNQKTMAKLVESRDPSKFGTAYISAYDALPEPLCAIYEPSGYHQIISQFKKGVHCPRKIINQSNAKIIKQNVPNELDNVNTPEDYQHAMDILKSDNKAP